MKLEAMIETALKIASPVNGQILKEEWEALKEYPSNYQMGVVLKALAEIYQEDF